MVQQRQVLLGLLALVEMLAEAVIGQTEAGGREQVVAVCVVGERTWLTHQRIDHVPVMYRMLVPTDQSRQHVHLCVGVPDLDPIGIQPRFDALADQPAMHRVAVAMHVDQASRIDATMYLEATAQTHLGQSLQRGSLLGNAITPRVVATLHQLLKEADVLRTVGEIPAATQQQRLISGVLEVVVGRFGVTILVRLTDVDPLTGQTIVPQQILVAGLELPLGRQVVDRSAEAVGAMQSGHATQFPQRVLQTIRESLERLRQTQADRLPVRVGQDKMIDQMIERLTTDGDAQ